MFSALGPRRRSSKIQARVSKRKAMMIFLSRILYLVVVLLLASCSNSTDSFSSENVLSTTDKKQFRVNFGGLPSTMYWELKEPNADVYLSIETNYHQEVDQLAINYHKGKKRCQTGKNLVKKGAKKVMFDCTGYRGHQRYVKVNRFLDVASVNLHCGNEVRELSLPETFLLNKDLRWLDATLDNHCSDKRSLTNVTIGEKRKFSRSIRKTHLSPNDVPNRSYDYTKPLQECLTGLGFDVGTPNGIAGAKTRKGIEEFQLSYEILVTGEVDVLTYTQCWNRYAGWESVKQDVFNSVK